jgi:hypothetical protein
MTDNNGPLAKFRGVLPSRAKLAQLSLFGTTEEARSSAQALLDTLPPMTAKEKDNWSTAIWQAAKLPCEADMEKSPIGRQTLAMLRANAPDAPVKPGPSAVDPEAPAEPAVEVVNPIFSKLNWPPQGSLMNQKPKTEEEPRNSPWPKYTAGTPSKPDTSQRPISDEDFSSNAPVY